MDELSVHFIDVFKPYRSQAIDMSHDVSVGIAVSGTIRYGRID